MHIQDKTLQTCRCQDLVRMQVQVQAQVGLALRTLSTSRFLSLFQEV